MTENTREEIETKVFVEREGVSLPERQTTQSDQSATHEKEKEIRILTQDLESCRNALVTMETDSTCERKRLREELLSFVQKCKQLEDDKRELEENIGLYKEQNKVLHLNYQQLEAKCMELEEELSRADKQNDSIDQIRKDNSSLKTQVLLLSELYQGLKDRFAVINKNATSDEFLALESEVRNKELTDLKSKLETTIHQMEAFKMKCNEVEALMAKKETVINDQKNIIENNKVWHKKQLQVERQRISALNSVIRNHEIHILSLYAKLGLKPEEEKLRQRFDLREEYDPNNDNGFSNGNNS